MERNKMSAICMLAVILGAAGLGVGAFSVINMQSGAVKDENGNNGKDGEPGSLERKATMDKTHPEAS